MQATGNVNVTDSVMAVRQLGPFVFLATGVVIFWCLFLYYKWWPFYQETVREREKFHQTLVNAALARVDAANEKIPAALDRFSLSIQAILEKLWSQGERNGGKLDTIIDKIPTMEEAERRWRQATDNPRR
jgi:hypothetical protein